MEFNVNHPILFALVAVIIAAVLAQSVYFLVKSYRRAKEKGMDMKKIKKTMVTAAVFTVAPAISIVITVLVLSNSLGLALPWLRLSVVGSLSYETVAAAGAASGMGTTLAGLAENMTAQQYVTIASVMTVSIMVGIWLVPVVAKKMQKGMITMEKRDKKWSEIFTSAMFIGMISAFVGYVFCNVSTVFSGDFSGIIPVLVMLVSGVMMLLAGLLSKKTGWRWINEYALPISLLAGMASAIPLTAWLA